MSSETQKILTTDGIPLEESLKKAEKKNKIKAFLLVCPLLFFIIITYVFPIGDMLFRSVDDRMVTNMLPKTYKAMESWDGKELPEEEVFAAFYQDYKLLIKETMMIIEKFLKLHIRNQVDAGANIIQIFDSWAGLLDSKIDDYIPVSYTHLTLPTTPYV